MDEKIEKMLVRIVYLSLGCISLMLLIRNLGNPWAVLLLIGFLNLTFTFKKAVLDADTSKLWSSIAALSLEALAVFVLCLLDVSSIALWLYFVLVVDTAFSMPSWAVAVSSALCFAFQSVNIYMKNPGDPLFGYLEAYAVNLIIILVLMTIQWIVRYQGTQKQKLSDTMLELKVKSLQLSNAYLKLKETSEELEEMTILMERNRIAREIHDTVGHTLTTVLLELEAAERLIPIDPKKASEKLSIAKGQVRKGLADIRESVHTLKAGHEIIGLQQSLKLLLEDTEKSGSVRITSSIGEVPSLTREQEKMIYRALQEGLTNGIRHGNSTAFIFQLYYKEGFVHFVLSDNGKGAKDLEQGFGLSSMEERVKSLGGTILINTGPDEGFTIMISIPVIQADQGEPDENQITSIMAEKADPEVD